jgi:hypothetical protein
VPGSSDNRFLVSVLSRENQHEVCVYARKFSNLMLFGCWWFLNNPSMMEEVTRERIELLGTSFILQHSDARVLEQVIYKWRNTRATLAPILTETYRRVSRDGRGVRRRDIERRCQSSVLLELREVDPPRFALNRRDSARRASNPVDSFRADPRSVVHVSTSAAGPAGRARSTL